MDEQTPSTDAPAAGEVAVKESPKLVLHQPSAGKGSWRAAPYIFAAGTCDFLASSGIMVNMMKYLQDTLKLQTSDAATTITNFMGMCSYTPMLGAFLADAYVGRYRAVLASSGIYCLGLLWLVLTATMKFARPEQCKQKECLGYLYLAFSIIALGAGGIRPNATSFGADQFDQKVPKQRKQLVSFFNWYYFFVVAAVLVAATLLVYVQNSFGWGWGFGIPAMLMAVAVALFWAGAPTYRHISPEGSPFTRLAQVIVAAYRRRHLEVPRDPSLLYHEKRVDREDIGLCHTTQFRFLDKAATLTDTDVGTEDGPHPWNLCSVQQVEELKCLLRMAPVWLTGIPVFIAWSQQNTLWVQQAYAMDLRVAGSFKIPAASITIFAFLTMMLFLPLYDRLLLPLARKATGNARGFSFLQRIGAGVVMTSVSLLVAGVVERKRRRLGAGASVFWLVPQYSLVGLAESFVTIGYLEFFYDQSPSSMRSMASAVVWAIIGTGNYCSSFIVTTVAKSTDWLASIPDHGHYEYFYWILAAIVAADFMLHLVVAKTYQYTKPDYHDDDGSVPMGML